jgi:hypothetical protein
MRRERTYVVMTLIAAILVNLIGLVAGQTWNPVIYFAIPILLLLLLYFLVVSQMLNLEATIVGAVKSVSRGFEYIADEDSVKRALVEAIDEAKDFVFATGGRARDVDYLDALSRKVSGGETIHCRVILGDHIHHVLHQHLAVLLTRPGASVHVGHLREEAAGNMLVTDDRVMYYLPSPSSKGLERVLMVQDARLASRYRTYIMQLYAHSRKITEESQLRELCLECGAPARSPEA